MKPWLLIALIASVACAPSVDEDTAHDATPARPDECGEGLPTCPLDVPCVDGRCASDQALCSREGHCGALFNCRDGACVVDDEACREDDAACCTDTDCSGGDACIAFSCAPRTCWSDRDCAVFYGLGGTCSSTSGCGDGESCVQFWPPRCVDPDACCDGCQGSLVSDINGNGAIACTYQGRCNTEGVCVWSSTPPPGGEFH
jgi:hypothetical protein